jgi:hypothetical protein
MAVPTAASETVPIIALRANPTPFLRLEFNIAPRINLSFLFPLPRGPTQLRGQIHSSLWQLEFQILSVLIIIELCGYLYGAKGLRNRRSVV